jgi:excisionase family DNA binding protein
MGRSRALARTAKAVLPLAEEQPTIKLWPDTGRALGCGRSAIYEAAARGEIPVIRLGRKIVVPTAALRRMLHLDDDESPA